MCSQTQVCKHTTDIAVLARNVRVDIASSDRLASQVVCGCVATNSVSIETGFFGRKKLCFVREVLPANIHDQRDA